MSDINTINGNNLRDSRMDNVADAVLQVVEAVNKLAPSEQESVSMLDIYPIGSIYMSVNNTDPKNLFGGTWEQIQGRFLFAVDANHAVNSTGGEETHTLTVNEMPSHSHGYYDSGQSGGGAGSEYHSRRQNPLSQTTATGGGQPHNNMPPYLSVYM